MMADVDVRDILGAIRVPTLILHAQDKREEATFIASRIPGAHRFEVSRSAASTSRKPSRRSSSAS